MKFRATDTPVQKPSHEALASKSPRPATHLSHTSTGTPHECSPGAADRVLTVIGYGNAFCRDDGVGPVIVEQVAQEFEGEKAVRFIVARQLTPEIAADLDTRRAILIDASVALTPGEVRVSRVHASKGLRASMTHQVGDGYLMALAGAVFGHVPQAVSIAVGGADFDPGEGLSPEVRKAADAVTKRLSRHIRGLVARVHG